jgi:hypothetical protein
MKNFKNYLIATLLLFANGPAMANSDSSKLQERVEKIEEFQSLQEQKFDLLKDQINTQLSNFENDYNWLGWIFGGSFGVTALIGLYLWFFSLPKKIEALAEIKANEKLSAYFEEKKSRIEAIVRGADEDEKLKKQKKIIVVSNTAKGDDTDFLGSFLKQSNFSTEFIEMDEYQEIKKSYDILLINNEKGNFTDKKDLLLADLKPNTLLFFFGQGIRLDDDQNRHFSSATFRSQLYGNLMSALRYQRLID